MQWYENERERERYGERLCVNALVLFLLMNRCRWQFKIPFAFFFNCMCAVLRQATSMPASMIRAIKSTIVTFNRVLQVQHALAFAGHASPLANRPLSKHARVCASLCASHCRFVLPLCPAVVYGKDYDYSVGRIVDVLMDIRQQYQVLSHGTLHFTAAAFAACHLLLV